MPGQKLPHQEQVQYCRLNNTRNGQNLMRPARKWSLLLLTISLFC